MIPGHAENLLLTVLAKASVSICNWRGKNDEEKYKSYLQSNATKLDDYGEDVDDDNDGGGGYGVIVEVIVVVTLVAVCGVSEEWLWWQGVIVVGGFRYHDQIRSGPRQRS